MSSIALKRRIQRDLHGLQFERDALTCLVDFIELQDNHDEAIDRFVESLEKSEVVTKITKALVSEVINGLFGGALETELIQVISAYEVPKIKYEPVRKSFYKVQQPASLRGGAADKLQLYLDRFQLLHQRLRRNRLFSRPVFGDINGTKREYCELTELKALLGVVGETKYVMGCISQLEDGRYFLEDLSASLPVDLSEAASTSGFFTENCIVVAEGQLQSTGIFHCQALGFPPLETRDESCAAAKGLDFFGGQQLRKDEVSRAVEWECMNPERMIVCISHVWLDKSETFDMLRTVLGGYDGLDEVPPLFIFMGDFHSFSCKSATCRYAAMKENFARLAALLSQFQQLQKGSRFVFVPGPGDPGPGHILPRPPLPAFFTSDLCALLPNCTFATNPCRIRYCTQEIVVFRDDLQYRMRRINLLPPSGDSCSAQDMYEHLCMTLLQQSHLCPVPLESQPVFWQFDHALHLYPLPDLLLLSDSSPSAIFSFSGCNCINPGLFADGNFAAYLPATRETQLCDVPLDKDS